MTSERIQIQHDAPRMSGHMYDPEAVCHPDLAQEIRVHAING